MKQRLNEHTGTRTPGLAPMREDLKADGLGDVQRGLLAEIDRLQRRFGATYVRELARNTDKKPGETCDRLKQLRQRGLIEDAPDGVRDNHGARMVRLTREGRAAL